MHTLSRTREALRVDWKSPSLMLVRKPFTAKNRNFLTAAVTDSEWQTLEPCIDLVQLTVGQTLFYSGEQMTHIYFPIDCILSLMVDLEDGGTSTFAIIGNEGLAGIFAFMSTTNTSSSASVLCAGSAYRMSVKDALDKFNTSASFRRLILRYTQALMIHSSQLSSCYRHHSIHQQLSCLLLSCLLLSCLDRVNSNELILTQDLIAHMLGVRREGVTHAAKDLQDEGLIKYSRGHIHILDRPGIEIKSCECYKVIKTQYLKLLPNEIAL